MPSLHSVRLHEKARLPLSLSSLTFNSWHKQHRELVKNRPDKASLLLSFTQFRWWREQSRPLSDKHNIRRTPMLQAVCICISIRGTILPLRQHAERGAKNLRTCFDFQKCIKCIANTLSSRQE